MTPHHSPLLVFSRPEQYKHKQWPTALTAFINCIVTSLTSAEQTQIFSLNSQTHISPFNTRASIHYSLYSHIWPKRLKIKMLTGFLNENLSSE